MKLLAGSMTTLLLGFSAFAGDLEPIYNPKTEINVDGVIAGMREVSKGALQGVYVTVKTRSETFDVYLGPSNFLKLFDVEFKNGREVETVGAKAKFEDTDIVLAREVHIGKIVLTLRDAKGTPQWLWMIKHDVPTGL